jgi:hypothetical protein
MILKLLKNWNSEDFQTKKKKKKTEGEVLKILKLKRTWNWRLLTKFENSTLDKLRFLVT